MTLTKGEKNSRIEEWNSITTRTLELFQSFVWTEHEGVEWVKNTKNGPLLKYALIISFICKQRVHFDSLSYNYRKYNKFKNNGII